MNQLQFKILVNRMIGNKTKKEFCAKINITPEYLSRLLNDNNKTVPSLKLLQNMIAISEDKSISIDDLKTACGYTIHQTSYEQSICQHIITEIDILNIELFQTNEYIDANNIETSIQQFLAKYDYFYNNLFDCSFDICEINDCQSQIASKLLNNNESYILLKLTYEIDDFNINTLSFYCILAGHFSKKNIFYINRIFYQGIQLSECTSLQTKVNLQNSNIETAQYISVINKEITPQIPCVKSETSEIEYITTIQGYGMYLDKIPPNILEYAYKHRLSWCDITNKNCIKTIENAYEKQMTTNEIISLKEFNEICHTSNQKSWVSIISNTITNESDFNIGNYSNIDTTFPNNKPMIVCVDNIDTFFDKAKCINVLLQHAKELGMGQIEYCYQQTKIKPQKQIYTVE